MSPLEEGSPDFKLKGLGNRLGDEEIDSSLDTVGKELWGVLTAKGMKAAAGEGGVIGLRSGCHQLLTVVQNEISLSL